MQQRFNQTAITADQIFFLSFSHKKKLVPDVKSVFPSGFGSLARAKSHLCAHPPIYPIPVCMPKKRESREERERERKRERADMQHISLSSFFSHALLSPSPFSQSMKRSPGHFPQERKREREKTLTFSLSFSLSPVLGVNRRGHLGVRPA